MAPGASLGVCVSLSVSLFVWCACAPCEYRIACMGPLSECVSLCCYLRLSLFTAISQPSSRQLTPGGPATQTLTLMSGGWRTGAGGAAQPTLTPGGAAQPAFSALPHDASELTVAFYNVGIQLSQVGTKKWEESTEKQLAADIVKAANEHALDILCLSELGELGKGIGTKLPEGNVIAWMHREASHKIRKFSLQL